MSFQQKNLYANTIRQQTMSDLATGERINYQYDSQMNNYQNRINQNDFQLGLGAMAYVNKGTDFNRYNAITAQRLYKPTVMTEQQQKAKDAASRYRYTNGQVPSAFEPVILHDQFVPTYTNKVQVMYNTYQYPGLAQQIVNNVEAGALYENQFGFKPVFQQQKNQIYQNMMNSYKIDQKVTSKDATGQFKQVNPQQVRQINKQKPTQQIMRNINMRKRQ